MKRRPPVRKLAEWMTLGVSIVTILGLVGYLLLDYRTPFSPYVELIATPAFTEARQIGGRFVLPIDVENRGTRTVSHASFRITIAGDKGEEHETVELEYLARTSKQRIYKYLEREPRSSTFTIVPGYYKLD